MAYYGVQHRGALPAAASAALAELQQAVGAPDGPAHHDRAWYVDEAGYDTLLTVLYWTDVDAYRRWTDVAPRWTAPERHTPDAGFFSEIISPSVDRFETLFSNDRTEGVSVTATRGLSGEIREHAYWGGMRDRIPLTQTDGLAASGDVTAERDGPLVIVRGPHNLCLIRSGQEWSETQDDERRMYLDDVEPALRAGMEFLRDDGLSIGCFANRYVRLIDDDGHPLEKSFGMSWWRSAQELETWAESHPTHLAIFREAMKYLSTMGPAARLRLYHEVSVVTPLQQDFRYLGCHDATGLLRALR